MNKKTAQWFKAAVRVTAAAGVIWVCVGLRDLFAPRLFRFDGQVAAAGTVILDFAVGAVFLFTALSLYKGKPRDLQGTS